VLAGLEAVPVGLWLLARTRGVKRWLVPPFLLTLAILVAALWAAFAWLRRAADGMLPEHVSLGRWGWLERALDFVYRAGTSGPLYWLVAFLVGSLVAWYAFSVVYEALAGPFLDEVQGRFEQLWFGADPRSRLERPNDIPEARCWRLTVAASAGAAVLLLIGVFAPGVPFLAALIAAPVPFLTAAAYDLEYGAWLAWIARVEGRATWVSLQTAAVTGVLLLFALPLYFVPFGVGYVLFALVAGFATAIGLLDIPFERRGIRVRQRLRFVFRNLPAMLAFGIVAGLLLAVPVAGPILMVPSASIGGLWLLCRLDKEALRSKA